MSSNRSPTTTTTTTTTSSQAPPNAVDISTLPPGQLSQLKSQLDTELNHLTNSFQKLAAAQQKFRDCIKSIRDGIEKPFEESRTATATSTSTSTSSSASASASASSPSSSVPRILVPLTTSLYVPGRLSMKSSSSSSSPTVLVDVGTGFYVEKTTGAAISFYEGKIEELTVSLKNLEEVVKGKSGNLKMIEEVLRTKILAQQQQQPQGPSGGRTVAAG